MPLADVSREFYSLAAAVSELLEKDIEKKEKKLHKCSIETPETNLSCVDFEGLARGDRSRACMCVRGSVDDWRYQSLLRVRV